MAKRVVGSVGFRCASPRTLTGETWTRTRRPYVLAECSAHQRQSRQCPDQRQCTGDDEGGVETASCGNNIAGHDRRQQAEGITAQDKKGRSPPCIAGRAQHIGDQGTVGGRPDMGGRYRNRDQSDDCGE